MRELLMIVEKPFKIYGKGTTYAGVLESTVKAGDRVVIVADTGEFHAPIWRVETFAKTLEIGEKGQNVGLFFSYDHVLPTNGKVKIYKILDE